MHNTFEGKTQNANLFEGILNYETENWSTRDRTQHILQKSLQENSRNICQMATLKFFDHQWTTASFALFYVGTILRQSQHSTNFG